MLTLVELEDWKFIRQGASGFIHLVHNCPRSYTDYSAYIITYSAWKLKKCGFCNKEVPDDVHSLLHLFHPDIAVIKF